jgi:hypothetical protein
MPWPGNITSLRVSIAARSAQPVAAGSNIANSTDVKTLLAMENRAQVDLSTSTGWYSTTNPSRYTRVYLRGAVRTFNLQSSGLVIY